MSRTDDGPIKVLFELSGEHPTLPLAELLACARTESPAVELLSSGPGYAILLLEQRAVSRVASRLALCHRYGRYLGEWTNRGKESSEFPEGTMAVRVRSYQRQLSAAETEHLTMKLAEKYAQGRAIDLERPDVELRALASDRVHTYLKLGEIDRQQYEERAVKERPFFSPISLHPRFARALVNLTGLRAGQSILDPFCGTGGILLEAALLGLKVYGSDLSERMIEGCRINLDHFDLNIDRLEVLDVGDIVSAFGQVDGVASDPPYGRATSTNKERLDPLYMRSLQATRSVLQVGGKMALVFPRLLHPPSGMEVLERHQQRVHRSLTRHYHIMLRSH